MIYLSKNLIFLRRRFGVSQSQLALRVDKRQSTIGNWENDQTYPDAEDLVKINQYFGISIDLLLMVDLEKGNLITDEISAEFKQNGKVISNLIGNLKPILEALNESKEQGKGEQFEDDQTKNWALIKLLKGMDEKLDQIRDSLGNKP